MKKNLLTTILLFSLTFVFSQETKVVLDSSFYRYGLGSIAGLELRTGSYYEYNIQTDNVKETIVENGIARMQIKTYNNLGLVDTIVFLEKRIWDTIFIKVNRSIYCYNVDSLVINQFNYYWNTNDNNWVFRNKEGFSYNSDKKMVEHRISSNNERYYWEYKDDGLLIKKSRQEKVANDWRNLEETSYSYDSQNNLLEELYEAYGGFLPIYDRDSYTYNAENLLITKTHYALTQPPLIILRAYTRDSFVYNNQNQLVESYFFTNYSDWNLLRSTGYTYYPNGLLQETFQLPINGSKTEYFYNTENQIIEEQGQYYWDTLNLRWDSGLSVYYTYDDFQNLSKKSREQWNYNLSNELIERFYEHTYFYSEKEILKIEDSEPEGLTKCLFTNPYQISTIVNCIDWEMNTNYDLQVYSVDGSLKYSDSFNGFEGFRVNKYLHRGWYVFVVLEDEKVLQTQKILVF
jgi:hypothetical protein